MMKGKSHRMCTGLMMLVFGVLFFLGTLGVWPEFTLAKYWPLVIIVLGLHKMLCMKCGKDRHEMMHDKR